MYYSYVKRMCDFVVALVAIVFLSPVLLMTAIAIRLESRGPIIFKQERLGFKGKPFWIYKFRSMVVGVLHSLIIRGLMTSIRSIRSTCLMCFRV